MTSNPCFPCPCQGKLSLASLALVDTLDCTQSSCVTDFCSVSLNEAALSNAAPRLAVWLVKKPAKEDGRRRRGEIDSGKQKSNVKKPCHELISTEVHHFRPVPNGKWFGASSPGRRLFLEPETPGSAFLLSALSALIRLPRYISGVVVRCLGMHLAVPTTR